MKLTKIAAVLITTISLSNTAFSADKPNLGDITWGGGMEVQPGDTGWPSDLPTWGAGGAGEDKPLDPGHSIGDAINAVSDVAYKAYDQAQINKENIAETNGRIDDAIRSGQTIVDRQDAINKKQAEENVAIANNIKDTNDRIDDVIRSGETIVDRQDAINKKQADENVAIANNIKDTNSKLEDTNSKLDSSLEEQKKVNYLVGNALASNESYWQQQWATNENYAASINKNTSDIAKNRQDINKLNSRVDRLDQKVDDLNDTMKRGFASQAALNGLFQPYGVGKLNATMALGGYESKTAIAAGTGYRFDENTAVKAGIATNTDDFKGVTYNVGVNFEW
ncbi:YadA C-terminal domain-containing protein [Providencia stuartii]|uniref:YadA-like domain protein n=1 Tax=Providencia stuartii ATCC 25827 TaxID=471874 RepID=A0AA86Z272_PROST|nr:YadA C-terminal domain-containing protein [Providencia stuartii]EDU60939.1 YadA-like domain protein [Providencia stuartii ATCC 25827]